MNLDLDYQMNQMLDGLLNEEEEQALKKDLLFSEQAGDMWQNMQIVDATFSNAKEFSPSLNFTDGVMSQVDRYERQQSWRPWIIVLLVMTSSISVMTVTAPLLFVAFGLHNYLMKLPIVGPMLRLVTQGAKFLIDSLLGWITFVTSDPFALAVVISALVVVSTYVGLREAQRVTARSSRAHLK